MPSSLQKLVVESSASMYAANNGVKRKMEESLSDHGSSWERELSWEGHEQDSKRHCGTVSHFQAEPTDTQKNKITEYSMQETSTDMHLSNQPQALVEVATGDENMSTTDMEVDYMNEDQACSKSNDELVQTTNRTDMKQCWSNSAPRCYCRLAWDTKYDLVPYISDIY